LQGKVDKLVNTLELAAELLPIAEHNQDDEWYANEQKVYEALAEFKNGGPK
jgi:hypothetical protein